MDGWPPCTAGCYRLLQGKSVGSVEKQINVVPYFYAPHLHQPTLTSVVKFGRNTCMAWGSPRPTVDWQRAAHVQWLTVWMRRARTCFWAEWTAQPWGAIAIGFHNHQTHAVEWEDHLSSCVINTSKQIRPPCHYVNNEFHILWVVIRKHKWWRPPVLWSKRRRFLLFSLNPSTWLYRKTKKYEFLQLRKL